MFGGSSRTPARAGPADGRDPARPRPLERRAEHPTATADRSMASCAFARGHWSRWRDTPLSDTPLDQFGRPDANADMAWAGPCAYVSGAGGANPLTPGFLATPPPGGGVAVVDVADPTKPKQVANLRDPGALATSETLGAV